MIDINLFRKEKGGNPDLVRDSMKKRYKDPSIVDAIIQKDDEWRKLKYVVDQIKCELNKIKKEIGNKKKADKNDKCETELKQKDECEAQIKLLEENEQKLLAEIQKLVRQCGNLVHESVPFSKNEKENAVVRTWGEIPKITVDEKNPVKGSCHHHEVLYMIDGYEPQKGATIAGHRGYFLKGPGALLNMALQAYGMQFLNKQKYTPLYTPFFMKKEIMGATCQLSDFDESLYKVSGNENEEYYLIATSEQPISAFHYKEWLQPSDLPKKFAGCSSCFRKEAGAYGKDMWGIFRVHQFEKIEQFVITKPEDSWKAHEEMILVAEQFYQSLKLPYQVINIVSGELNDAAAKKYDLEAWFPGYHNYRELVSCSNCTDYQSRALEIRYGFKNKSAESEKLYVHMLNATLCATQRTLCCILENYQTPTGVKVPDVLVPFFGADFIPYVKEVPKQKDLQ